MRQAKPRLAQLHLAKGEMLDMHAAPMCDALKTDDNITHLYLGSMHA